MYAPSNNMLEEREKLGEKHTHFLFVDNGTSGKYGIERKFRVKLERFLCNPRELFLTYLFVVNPHLFLSAQHLFSSLIN